MTKTYFAATVALGLIAGLTPAHADFWQRINPFHPITPNWGSLIPHPQTFQELAPPCWGQPQNCRNENMPGDAKPTSSPSPAPTVEAQASITSICVQPDGSEEWAVAWFAFMRPAQYGQMQAISVANQKQCAEHGISGSYLTANSLTIAPTGWTETTFANGAKVWLLRGHIL